MMKRLVLILFLCSTCCAQFNGVKPTFGTQIQNWPKGLVGYWLFNEMTGTWVNDLSGNGNHGTITGAAWVGGKFGPCLDFEATSAAHYINVGAGPTLNITGDHTIVAWVKGEAIAGSAAVFSKVQNSGAFPGYVLHWVNSGQLRYYNAGCGFIYSTDFGLGYFNGQWHQIAVAVDVDVGGRFYVDGKLAGSWSDTTSVPGLYTGDGWIGRNYAGQYYDGLIDSVSVYGLALLANDIAQLYYDTFWMFRDEPSSMWVTAAAPPAGGSAQVIIIAKAAVPIVFPLAVILSMAVLMRRERNVKSTKGSSIC